MTRLELLEAQQWWGMGQSSNMSKTAKTSILYSHNWSLGRNYSPTFIQIE